jgi:signal transduction histidine kinase
LPTDAVRVHGDPVRLAQIVSNLLDNACKYTAKGGDINLAVLDQGAWVSIVVTDNGMGITEEALPHIFDLFVQGTNALANRGLGIGLAVVRDLVEAHSGTVVAASAGCDLGSQFTVRLPTVP